MDQVKIGKFIASIRKEKNMTQEDLAERLGVTSKSVSRWENGRTMPDLSIMKTLCEELNITINELLSGERIKQKEYQKKLEENIVNTIDYSTKKVKKYNMYVSLVIIIFGLFISLSAIMIFPSESSWGSIYSVLGIMIFMIGINKILNISKWFIKLLLIILIFIMTMSVLLITDYINVLHNDEAPRFRLTTTTTGNVIYYNTYFYDVYRCNFDEDNEYWVIEKNSNPTINELIDYCHS